MKNNKISSLSLVFGLLFIQYYLFIPITKRLLDSNPSVIGFAEYFVFIVHCCLSSIFFLIYFILEKILDIKIVLLIVVFSTLYFDYVIYTYCKVWMIVGLFLIKFSLLFFTHNYYKNNISRNNLKSIISLICLFIIILTYFLYKKF